MPTVSAILQDGVFVEPNVPAAPRFALSPIVDPYVAAERELARQRDIARAAPRVQSLAKTRASAPFRPRSLRRVSA